MKESLFPQFLPRDSNRMGILSLCVNKILYRAMHLSTFTIIKIKKKCKIINKVIIIVNIIMLFNILIKLYYYIMYYCINMYYIINLLL